MTYSLRSSLPPSDARFVDTSYVVEATEEEFTWLWYRWSELAGAPMRQEGAPWQAEVGAVADRAMVARVTWVTVDLATPVCVAFADLISRSEAWSRHAADGWQRIAFPCLRPPGAWGERRRSSSEFIDVLRSGEWTRDGEFRPLLVRSNEQILRAVRAVPLPTRDPAPLVREPWSVAAQATLATTARADLEHRRNEVTPADELTHVRAKNAKLESVVKAAIEFVDEQGKRVDRCDGILSVYDFERDLFCELVESVKRAGL